MATNDSSSRLAGPPLKALLYVQHLLGTGHLKRTALIADALTAQGVDTHVVSGGFPVAAIDSTRFTLHQLEPVRAKDATFSTLVDRDGNEVSEAVLNQRRDALVALAAQIDPDVVLVETWPFGRRKLRHELTALVTAIHEQTPRPAVVCSVRDILQRGRKPKRLVETVDLTNRWFDAVLVHADPTFVQLEHSFEAVDTLQKERVYTGFVVDPAARGASVWEPTAEAPVLVSAGGGAVGLRLYETAIDAAVLLGAEFTWHLLIGRGLDAQAYQALSKRAPAWVTVEWARSDFPTLLTQCGLSISQAGYNTSMDLLGVGCPAIVVPFDLDGETEQVDRATRMMATRVALSLPESRINARVLADAVVARHGQPTLDTTFEFDGASHSAQWLERIAKQSRRS